MSSFNVNVTNTNKRRTRDLTTKEKIALAPVIFISIVFVLGGLVVGGYAYSLLDSDDNFAEPPPTNISDLIQEIKDYNDSKNEYISYIFLAILLLIISLIMSYIPMAYRSSLYLIEV